MAGKAFIDTNILLRANNYSLPLHDEANHLIRQARGDGYELWISRQIIREYLAQVTRPRFLDKALSIEQVETQIKAMRAVFKIADETEQVTIRLLELLRMFPTGGKQVHDANIVATMLVYEIDTLLTHNVDDMKRFASRISITPLVEDSR